MQLCFSGSHSAGGWQDQSFYMGKTLFVHLYHYYRSAPGFCAENCTGPQSVAALKVSVSHWLIWSLVNAGHSGFSSVQNQANGFPIVYVILAIDSWKYCSGKHGQTAQHLSLNVCFTWLHWKRGSVLSCGRGSYHKVAALFVCFAFMYMAHLCKED